MNSQELAASSLVAERLSRGLGSERAATAAADIAAAQLLLVLVRAQSAVPPRLRGGATCRSFEPSMAPPGSHSSGPRRAAMRPRRPHGAAKNEVPPHAISFWWLWPVATGTAAAMMTAVAEHQLQRGVPTMVGAIGGLIIGGVKAALMTHRGRGHHLGWRRLIWLALATMVCLALALSATVLAAPGFAIDATLGAGTIGACFTYQPWGRG
jgi:hypothetical protein